MFKFLKRNNRLVMLALFVWALGEGLWFNLRQLYLVELGATPTQVGIALAIESVTRAVLLIPAGLLSDRIGPYRLMIVAWLVGIGGPIALSLGNTWQVAVPGLVIYATSAFAVPAISSYALLNITSENIPRISERTLTAIYAAYPAGMIISPTLGGLLADRFDIRTTLWVGAGLFTLSMMSVLIAKDVAPEPAGQGDRPGDLLRNRAFVGMTLYYTLAYFTLVVCYPLAPNFLRDVRGFELGSIGLLYSVFALGTTVLNLFFGRLDPRWSFAGVLVAVWLAVLGLWHMTIPTGVAAAFFVLGAVYSARVLATASVARVVRPRSRGLAFSIIELGFSGAVALAAWVAGGLYDLTPAHDLPFVASLITIPVMLGLWFVVRSWQVPEAGLLDAPAAAAPGD